MVDSVGVGEFRAGEFDKSGFDSPFDDVSWVLGWFSFGFFLVDVFVADELGRRDRSVRSDMLPGRCVDRESADRLAANLI